MYLDIDADILQKKVIIDADYLQKIAIIDTDGLFSLIIDANFFKKYFADEGIRLSQENCSRYDTIMAVPIYMAAMIPVL